MLNEVVREGGQRVVRKMTFTETLQEPYRNRQKHVTSCVNDCFARYGTVFHGSIL